ncbi:hypothetical protein BGX38DRAFT_780868 [Terfezia claveryi]|nr:hypothetical protein BGX38DRAFT_780868 [Terfezia claveryi]
MDPICCARCYRKCDPALWTLTQDGSCMKTCTTCRSKRIVMITRKREEQIRAEHNGVLHQGGLHLIEDLLQTTSIVGAEYRVEYRAEYRTEHRAEHRVEHRAGYRAGHGTGHRTEYRTGHLLQTLVSFHLPDLLLLPTFLTNNCI